jgi:hypothetical protein
VGKEAKFHVFGNRSRIIGASLLALGRSCMKAITSRPLCSQAFARSGWSAAALLSLASFFATQPTPVHAQSLEGAWSGGGSVTFFSSGNRERARCRAHYSRRSRTTYVLNATCATASGRAAQSALLRQVGENRYSGNFYNQEYDIYGRIYVVVRGNSQNVKLSSRSGSGSFRLSR